MGTFKGKRIIPKHDGVWNQKKEYEELTIVLDAESGMVIFPESQSRQVQCCPIRIIGACVVISTPRCTDWKRMLQKMWKKCTGVFQKQNLPCTKKYPKQRAG